MGDGQEQYEWLYNKNAPEPTMQFDSASPPRSTQAEAELPPPNLPPPGSAGKPPRRRRHPVRWFVRFVALLLIAALTFYVSVGLVGWSKIKRVDAASIGATLPEQPGTTFLLVGTDKRPHDKSRGRTDSILLLHYGSSTPVLTSLPRDSRVKIPGHGTTKINAAYAFGGAPLLVTTIEQNTGIKIDGYVEIGFQGLVDVVDALDGIEICPAKDLKDKDSHLDITAGCQMVDGKTALAYSRNRHTYATGDVARGAAQREVIGAIGTRARSRATLAPRRYIDIVNSSTAAVLVSENVTLSQFARFGWKLSGVMSGNGLNCTVPIADLAVTWDPKRAPEFFGYIARDATDQLGTLCTANGLAPH